MIRILKVLTLLTLFSSATIAQDFNGYALYNKQNNTTTYLIDKDGNVAHSWSCAKACNYAVLLKDNGNIVRGAVSSGNQLSGGAIGGMVQELDANANVVWEFTYSDATKCSHHDITLLPNGNVLLIAWEVKSTAELTQAGYENASSAKWPTHFIEVQQNGTAGQIVWEWHIWDHMIQDNDASKDNYGVVADHPELMDINALEATSSGPGGGGGDWFHANGIDYNETLDQIVFSSRNASEIFIIDHSTTTAEAASHSGGNAGMGGDFLYRWGNPSNYGSSATQNIPAAVHDPRWIEDDGRQNGGYIQFFNNEGNNGGSAIDAINPSISGYNYPYSSTYYAPSTRDWRLNCLTNSTGQSSHNTMSNSNTFVNVSNKYMYEVDAQGNTVWQYNAGPAKAFRYECDHPGVAALLGDDPCGIGVFAGVSENNLSDLTLYPNPSNGIVSINGTVSNLDAFNVSVFNISGQKVASFNNQLELDLTNIEAGVYLVSIVLENGEGIMKKITITH